MNKKFLIAIIIIFTLIAGIGVWYASRKDDSNPQAVGNNKSASCDLTNNCNQSPEIKKNLVEIFYLPHPPAEAIVDKVDKILQKFPQYQVKKYDFYDQNNEKKIKKYNLIGHIPVAIFINGENTFLIDSREITFKNFPKGDAFVPTLEGSWSYDDLEKVLASSNK